MSNNDIFQRGIGRISEIKKYFTSVLESFPLL